MVKKKIMKNKINSDIKVSVNKLRPGMVIEAYVRFSEIYQSIDKSVNIFVRHNFRGTKAIIKRDGEKKKIQIEQLKVGDSLLAIYRFPKELDRIIHVTYSLIGDLKKRGMATFLVKQPFLDTEVLKNEIGKVTPLLKKSLDQKQKLIVSPLQKRHLQSVNMVNDFVEKVRNGVETREKASRSIENTMEEARTGTASTNEIMDSINEIFQRSSVDAMAAIANLKESHQTYDHCVDVGIIFQNAYLKIQKKRKKKSVFESNNQALLGGFLHDFGKSKIPKEILDSKDRFDRNSRAMQVIRSHPYLGAQQLSIMKMPDSIVDMAHYHHVKKETNMFTSYPLVKNYDVVSFEARLLSIIDIYQALVGTRNYKTSWTPPATLKYIDALSGIEVDQRVWKSFLDTMGMYPKGSLVELSDGSQGFVMSIPEEGENPTRPMVAIIRKSDGTALQHHCLVDLKIEKEIRIMKDVDRNKVFGDKALDVFANIDVT